jgi:hypothetical protein
MIKIALSLCILCLAFAFKAQTYNFGLNSFAFLNTIYSSRSAGLGSNLITISDNDIGLSVENPSLLSSQHVRSLQINQAILPSGVQVGMLCYAFKSKHGIFSPVIRFQNYGRFDGTDELGNATNSFSAIEYSLGMNYSRAVGKTIKIGAGINLIGSHMDVYSSLGVHGTMGATYSHPKQDLAASFIVKNIGFQLVPYENTDRAPLPVEVQSGISYKLNHAPFRISLLGHHLNHWKILYNDPNLQPTIDALSGDTIPVDRPGFGKNLASHFSYSLELLASDKLEFRTGFNYFRREQMKLLDRPGLSGFSFGIGIKLKKIKIDYGILVMSAAGSNHYLGISTNFDNWKKKRF